MRQLLTSMRFWLLVICIVATALFLHLADQAAAKRIATQPSPTPTPVFGEEQGLSGDETAAIDLNGFWETLGEIAPAILLAGLLGGSLAYRRRATVFEYDLFQAHFLLSVAGALMMLIVGNQLVRAFGLLGAASVVRYRYGLRNPRDASMLIIALGLGMATGVGLYALAVSAAVVVLLFSRGLDYINTHTGLFVIVTRPMSLQVRTTRPDETMANIDHAFARRGIEYKLRRYRRARKRKVDGAPVYLLDYSVRWDPEQNREQLTAEITDASVVTLQWNREKPRKG